MDNSAENSTTRKNPEKLPKVLVVEDDDFLLSLEASKLKKERLQVFFAANGTRALEMMEKEKPDVVLLDLLLPVMDGFDVLRKAKEDDTLKKIPIIVFSNLGDSSSIKKAKDLGAVDFFVKSGSTLEEVLWKVKKLLGQE